jgi:hypothetical protein
MEHMSNESEARALADQLVAYWHEQGFTTVKVWIELVPANDNRSGGPIYGVRSNLVGGLPPRDRAA